MFNPAFSKLRLEHLECRRVLSVSGASAANLTPPQTAYENMVDASVVDEQIFYGDSVYDGNNPAASAADDAAIATDKTPLLPDQTATFANYTSYSRGINGIMVDIAGLPQNVTANDFTFAVGNNNNPSSWTPLTVAPIVTVRWGAGEQGSARVELTWPNNTIQNEWLQVTVLADADTGLSSNVVFYYGNAIGETGNSTTDAQVTSADMNATASHEGPAGVTSDYDFNRDGVVNSQDVSIVRSNMTKSANALQLITLPAASSSPAYAAEQPAFMEAQDGFEWFNTPVIVETNDGTLICVAAAQYADEPQTTAVLVEKTSTDGGQTWSPLSVVATVSNYPNNYISMGSMVVDQKTGTVFLLYNTAGYDSPDSDTTDYIVYLMSSTNDGKTWSTPEDITSSVVEPAWQYISLGPGNGVQLTAGAEAGRLVVPMYYRYVANENAAQDPGYAGVMYSDDDGATWQSDAGPDPTNSQNAGNIEPVIAQLAGGVLYMNTRLKYAENTADARGYTYSYDGGITWTTIQYSYALSVDSVGGSLLSLDPTTLLFAAPDDPDTYHSPDDPAGNGARYQMTIWASFNNGQTWTQEQIVNYDYDSFSCMVALGHDTAMLVYVAGQTPPTGIDGNDTYEKVDLLKFNLNALLAPQPDQFIWNFNEQPIGATAPIGGSSIRDDGTLDERGTVQSSGGVPYYVAGADGDEALRIVNGSNVLLNPTTTDGLEFGAGQSFTFQFLLRTTTANGVLLGTVPGDLGYTFSLVNGAIALSLYDGTNTSTITGSTIDDGNWHTVVGIRNTANQTISLYVDGSLVATGQDTTGNLDNSDNITLGSYADGSDQTELDIDQLVVTRAALDPSQFLPSSYVPPQPLPAPTTPADGVLNLPGIDFYLGPYDDRHYFGDTHESDPLLLQPSAGTAARSAIDATDNYDVSSILGGSVYYESAPVVGSYWSAQAYTGWTVANSNGTDSPNRNFDFVQNTETFTISEMFNLPEVPTDGDIELVGNDNATSALPGFDLLVEANGNLNFQISDGTGGGTALVSQNLGSFAASNTSLPQLSTSQWYQVVIVGNGPGTPIQYYLTPITASAAQEYQTTTAATPIATPTATASSQDLQIGNVFYATAPGTPTLNFKDLAIFNTALSPAQVQQMFADETALQITSPVVTASNAMASYTLGASPATIDPNLTVSSNDADLTGASMAISVGTILPGDQLHFTNQNGITGNYNSATGTLALTGTATPAQYQTALESVQFSTTSGSILPQAITVLALDGSLTSNPAYEQINPVAVGPVVTASGTQAVYQWGGSGVAVDSGLEVSSDHATITGATMQITNPIVGDTLAFTNQNNITGSYNAATTTLSLTGTATPAQYQTALDSVTFSNTINAITSPRMITVAAFDANANPSSSNSISEQVNVTAPRSPTGAFVSSPAAAIIYGPGAPAAAISSGIVVSSGDGNLTGATVTISSGMQTGDSLNFSGTSQISGSYNSATGTLTLTGSASAAQYQAVLGSVTFSNATNTAVNNRSITFQVDGPSDSPTTSNSMTETVDLLAPATVMGLWVKGSAWSASFNNYLASNGLGNSATPSLGFALQTGASQSKDLPWINVNVIEAQFNEQVNVTQNSLILSGGTGGSTPSITGFSSLGNNTYAWTLSTALTRNQLEISFLATGPNAVTNNGGDGLSGNWTNGSSSFPSGNGLVGTTASSNFNFLFNELPGDVLRYGTPVTSSEAIDVRSKINTTDRSTNYNPYYDVIGTGVITSTDFVDVRARLNNTLPSNAPSPMSSEAGGTGATGNNADVGGVMLAVVEGSTTTTDNGKSNATSNILPTAAPAVATASSNAPASGADPSSEPAETVGTAGSATQTQATDAALAEFDLADL